LLCAEFCRVSNFPAAVASEVADLRLLRDTARHFARPLKTPATAPPGPPL
jgi:hypothetical protein